MFHSRKSDLDITFRAKDSKKLFGRISISDYNSALNSLMRDLIDQDFFMHSSYMITKQLGWIQKSEFIPEIKNWSLKKFLKFAS